MHCGVVYSLAFTSLLAKSHLFDETDVENDEMVSLDNDLAKEFTETMEALEGSLTISLIQVCTGIRHGQGIAEFFLKLAFSFKI